MRSFSNSRFVTEKNIFWKKNIFLKNIFLFVDLIILKFTPPKTSAWKKKLATSNLHDYVIGNHVRGQNPGPSKILITCPNMKKGIWGNIWDEKGNISKCVSPRENRWSGRYSPYSLKFTINNIYWIWGTRDDRQWRRNFVWGRWGTMRDDPKLCLWNWKVFFMIFNMFSKPILSCHTTKKTFQFQRRSQMRQMVWLGLCHGQWPIFAPPNSVFHWFFTIDRTPKMKKWKSG